MSYKRFAAMVGTWTLVMFGLMYSTVYGLEHVRWSQTRFWMTLFTGAAMAAIMLAFMRGMYADGKKNAAIFAATAVVFAVAMYLARSQDTSGTWPG